MILLQIIQHLIGILKIPERAFLLLSVVITNDDEQHRSKETLPIRIACANPLEHIGNGLIRNVVIPRVHRAPHVYSLLPKAALIIFPALLPIRLDLCFLNCYPAQRFRYTHLVSLTLRFSYGNRIS